MRGSSRPKWSFCILILLPMLAACIELEGQRITIDYDAERDHLSLILFYDGIHDNGEDDVAADNRDAETQIAKSIKKLGEFVNGGDVMFLDWFGHVEWAKIYRDTEDDSLPEAARELARAVRRDIKVTMLGHYKDPRGHIGAAQRVDIANASKFLDLANKAINQAILTNLEDDDDRDPLEAAAQEAARAGWTWMSLDGKALVGTFPLPRGWSTASGSYLRSALEDWARTQKKFEDGDDESPNIFTDALAAMSIDQQPRQVTVRLGFREVPNTVRFGIRRGYKDNLSAGVVATVPAEFDRLVAEQIFLGDAGFEAPLGGGLGPVPVEDRVRAMLWARSGDQKDAADAWLARFRDRWDAERRVPEAPNTRPDDPTWADSWSEWYAAAACSVE